MQAVVESSQPIAFVSVQLNDRDVADLGPRFVLKCVVVKKLAAKNQRNS